MSGRADRLSDRWICRFETDITDDTLRPLVRETLIEKRLFTGLEPLVQERLFAPTCFSEEQLYTKSVPWSPETIDERVVRPALERVSELRDESINRICRRLDYAGPRELAQRTLLHSDDFAVAFLAWYLETHLQGVACDTESGSGESEPDVSIDHRNVHACNVELKRVFSSGNVVSYVESFVSKPWHEFDPNHPSVLLFVFPCLEAPAWRIETVTSGYLSFCSAVDGWHTPSMHARLAVAPVEPNDENETLPLETTARYVRELLP